MKYKLINTDEIFVDATHVKACANSKNAKSLPCAHEQALWYEDELQRSMQDRQAHPVWGKNL